MTGEEYWFGEPRLVEAYREAQKIRNERRNQEMWLQGLYNLSAFSAVISNAFGGKGSKKVEYLKEPVELSPRELTPQEARKKLVEQLDAWKKAWETHEEIVNGDRN